MVFLFFFYYKTVNVLIFPLYFCMISTNQHEEVKMMIYTEKVIPFENRAGGKGTGILRIAMEDEQLEGRAKAIMSVTLHPGSSIGSHQHVGNLEIYYVLKGEGIFTVNGKSEPIHAGQAGSMNPGDWHSIENTGSEDMLISAVILYE